jgi:MYXO-CTERM domain-containing protein
MQTASAIILALSAASAASAGVGGRIVITEWMYSGSNEEFVELTNVGDAAIDLTGWSYDDNSQSPGEYLLSGAGVVNPGQSIIFTENTVSAFRAAWGLSDDVVILGEVTNNLGRNDEINIYDNNGVLVDRLTYGDEDFPGSIRTQNVSGWTTFANLGANNVGAWGFSSEGDLQGSYLSTGGDLGNPGVYVIPAPGAAAILGMGAFVATRRRR